MSTKDPVQRVTVKLGKMRRVFVLEHPPYPRVDDLLSLEGQDWPVVKVQSVKGPVFHIDFPLPKSKNQVKGTDRPRKERFG